MDQIKVGIIGSGYWGPNLIRNFVEIKQSEVILVADIREERLAHIHAIYPQIQVTRDFKEFFHHNLDAVVIATPPATHYEIAKECLDHKRKGNC